MSKESMITRVFCGVIFPFFLVLVSFVVAGTSLVQGCRLFDNDAWCGMRWFWFFLTIIFSASGIINIFIGMISLIGLEIEMSI